MKILYSKYAVILFILVLLIITNCSKDLTDYYPLKEGMKWKYQRYWDYNWTDDTKSKTVMVNLAPRVIEGVKVIPQTWDVEGSISLYFVTQNDSGIFIFAEQFRTDVNPKIKNVREYFLQNPIKLGTSWQINDEVYFYASGNKCPALTKYTIVSLDDVVTVPAGTFKNCLKVKLECIASDYIKNLGSVNITFQGFKWYAPGIGLVKSNWTEETDKNLRRIDANPKLEYSSLLLTFEK